MLAFTVILLLVYNYLFWTRMVYAGQKLHDTLITRLFHAPMSFFDTTPMGRIMNRVSRDIEVVIRTSVYTSMYFLSVLVLVVCVCARACVCVCVCVGARARECLYVYVRVCLCVGDGGGGRSGEIICMQKQINETIVLGLCIK